jgi:Cu-Zn family superoxide dismutase
MNRIAVAALAVVSLTAASACHHAETYPNDGATRAVAYLLDSAGRELGRVRLTQPVGSQAVTIAIELSRGATEGQHGIHIHSVGKCDGVGAFSSAGGHFNPGNAKHGFSNPEGPHAGDLEALTVDYMHQASFTSQNNRVTLTPGPNSLLDADGSAIVLHALPDDQRTDPSGNSGARIACGVIVKV